MASNSNSNSNSSEQHSPSSSTSPRRQLPTNRLHTRNPALASKIQQMAIPLSPLVSLTSGTTHPSFPFTVLNFWLLTSAQLDDLAAFYHQRTPGPYSACYPCPVYWDCAAGLEEKRRRLGRFIGLRGCESPGFQRGEIGEEVVGREEDMVLRSVEEIERMVQRERARRAEREGFEGRKGRWV